MLAEEEWRDAVLVSGMVLAHGAVRAPRGRGNREAAVLACQAGGRVVGVAVRAVAAVLAEASAVAVLARDAGSCGCGGRSLGG